MLARSKPYDGCQPGAAKPYNGSAAGKTVARLSTADAETVLRFDVPEMAEIDRRRAAAGITVKDLLAECRMRSATWYDALKPFAKTRVATRQRLLAALALLSRRLPARQKSDARLYLVRAIEHNLRTVILLTTLGGGDAAPELLRTFAIYLAAVECEVENAALARSLGCARQHIHQTRHKVEAMRDDPAVNALLDRVGAMLRGSEA